MKDTPMSAENVRTWRQRLKMTQEQAAAAIGRTKRMIQLYEGGTETVPLIVRLAMLAVELGYRDFDGRRGILRD